MNSEIEHVLGVNSTRITISFFFFPVGAKITHKPFSIIVEEGQNAILQCKASGRPTPRITWRRALSHLPKGKTRVAKSDSGAYECSAKNLLRQETAVAILMVIERLRFTISPPLKNTAKKSSDLMLDCKAQGSTVIIWKRAGNLLPGNHVIHRNGSLLLRNINSQDAGSYTCVAKNAQRSIQATSVVEVHIRKYTILSIRTSTKTT